MAKAVATASTLIKATPGQRQQQKQGAAEMGTGRRVGREVLPNADAAHNITPQCNAIQHCAALMTAVLVFWQRCQAGGGACISHCTAYFSLSLSLPLSCCQTYKFIIASFFGRALLPTHAAHATPEMHWVRTALAAQCAKWALQGGFIYTQTYTYGYPHLSTIEICWLLMPKTLVCLFS